VKRVKRWGVNQLYVVGGNGGNAAANAIQKECEAQAVLCSVVGIPKSIDNDILLVTLYSLSAGVSPWFGTRAMPS
jgi:6-phosphofructokinase 1